VTGPISEDTMTPGHTVTTHPETVRVEVRVGGETVAESERPLVLEETGLPPRYYLSRDDVRMERFDPTSFHTICPFKGEASYWSIEVGGTRHDGIMWSYEDPIAGREDITGLVSFYPDRAEVLVDGRPLQVA
jgi:uncharacterized protein (DUF427 family)